MSYYELATLGTVIFGAGKAAAGIEAWVTAPDAGTLCGAWTTDIGPLNQVILLRSFDTLAAMMAERERALRSDNPYGCCEFLTSLSMESHRALDFLPPMTAGAQGPVYELRSYRLRLNGLMPTMQKWQQAVPEREAYSSLAVAMYGLDGAPRLTQIWPYASLAVRSMARSQSVADGKWPPKGGPDWLDPNMTSAIMLPMAFSPLQ